MKFVVPVLTAALLCGAMMAARASESAATQSDLKPIVPGETLAQDGAPRVTHFAPLGYFNEKCARCHGQFGSFYGEDFGQGKTDAELRQSVDAMCQGPAQAPLEAHDLDVLTAWHKSLRDGKPFVALVAAKAAGAGFELQGEISPGASLEVNGKKVEVEGAKWTARVGQGAVKLRARQGDEVTEVDAQAAAFGP